MRVHLLLLLLLLVDLCLCAPRLREDKSLRRFFANARRRFKGAESKLMEIRSDPWDGLREIIAAVMACPGSNIPGLAVRCAPGSSVILFTFDSIVKDGKIVFAEGFGYRNLQTKEPVTNTTLFGIGPHRLLCFNVEMIIDLA